MASILTVITYMLALIIPCNDSVCRIQEVMDGDLREAGRVPRTMEAELTADLG